MKLLKLSGTSEMCLYYISDSLADSFSDLQTCNDLLPGTNKKVYIANQLKIKPCSYTHK